MTWTYARAVLCGHLVKFSGTVAGGDYRSIPRCDICTPKRASAKREAVKRYNQKRRKP